MLFMATHTATQPNGSADPAQWQAALHQVLCNAGQSGVVMRGVYDNALVHTVYFLFEADNADQIAALFAPIRAFGRVEHAPVVDRLAL